MREIGSCEDLNACCAGDALCMWAAQGLDGRSRAWASDDRRAVVVAGAALSARDRLAVWGDPDAGVPLVRRVLAQVGPTYRPFGDSTLIDVLVREIPGLTAAGTFGWMDRRGFVDDVRPADSAAAWLPGCALGEVELLVEMSFPDSYAKPGVPGVERWAGVRDHAGRLAAVGALAWCAPTVGFLSGVAVHPGARKRGFGQQVCAFLVTEALKVHGAAALMVNDWNHAARRLYEGMGLRYRPLSAATLRA
ncbi:MULTISPECIES: GNAT family N-acetyltransferase [unclassified Streptomyces]|uniref:GNAT family N-acetyltransferase n=1 Tax=unclassified Streptomyces TaxID=2593676 RepID=UPI0038174E70